MRYYAENQMYSFSYNGEQQQFKSERLNGDSYMKFKAVSAEGPNGNIIFFPFTGYKMESLVYDSNYAGYFWSSTPNGELAYILECFSDEEIDEKDYILCDVDKDYGITIRPVKDKDLSED